MAATMSTSHAPRRLLIQMSGAPGSGNSTMAKLLAQSIDAVVIDHDIVRSTVLNHHISFDEAAKLAYDLGWALGEDMIKQGRSVVIDSPCNYRTTLDQGSALAQQNGYEYWYVECKVDDIDLLDERLRKRVPLRSQPTGVDCPPPDANGPRDSANPRALFKRLNKVPCRPDCNAIVVDSTDSLEKRRDYILKRICPPTSVQT